VAAPAADADWRLIGLHMALIWTAAGQASSGRRSTSVQYKGFGWPATIVFGVVLILCCGLYLTRRSAKASTHRSATS
jgi:nicotinamide riboside transporter PnuC